MTPRILTICALFLVSAPSIAHAAPCGVGDTDGDGYLDAGLEEDANQNGDCADDDDDLDLSPNFLDCDNAEPSIHPGADENVADGIDQDCDAVDACYQDQDDDGYGTSVVVDGLSLSCAADPARAELDVDCDDTDPGTYPDATEVCDGIDQNCNALVDDNAADQPTWYADVDVDGFGDAAFSLTGCEQPPGFVPIADDCDDTDTSIHPGATEACDGVDQDCDGFADAVWYADADVDGYGDPAAPLVACSQPGGHVANDDDCDDTSETVHPGAAEACDGVDQDCDTIIDNEVTWYADVDSDGYGDSATSVSACSPPADYVAVGGDCDDADSNIHPGASDVVADGIDQDCDGRDSCYRDFDNDGYGTTMVVDGLTLNCTADFRRATVSTDCDDSASAIHPGSAEVCDPSNRDEDCDGLADDADPTATGLSSWYPDVDDDGFGSPGSPLSACDRPVGHAATTTDCDDADPSIHPGATEACDGVDQDCNAVIDDERAWYADVDEDGYGDPAASMLACSQPGGYIADDSDCDDTDPAIHPGVTEACDGIDQDCDGVADSALLWYADVDGDGYGDPATSMLGCSGPGDYVVDGSDCDDGDATTHPGATEVCDGIDQDCDGIADDDPPWYADLDGDGYGDPGTSILGCSPPVGYVDNDTDCDDADPAIRPSASETCDASDVDEDCDGLADDLDGNAVGKSAWYADADSDGFGDSGSALLACDQPAGALTDASDCDDADPATHPGAAELCNGVDDDCNGTADDALVACSVDAAIDAAQDEDAGSLDDAGAEPPSGGAGGSSGADAAAAGTGGTAGTGAAGEAADGSAPEPLDGGDDAGIASTGEGGCGCRLVASARHVGGAAWFLAACIVLTWRTRLRRSRAAPARVRNRERAEMRATD